MSPTTIILALSLLANVLLGWAYLGQRDDSVQATTNLTHATGAATACSAGVQSLETQADTRAAAAVPQRAQAAASAAKSTAKADQILAKAAAAPGDDCKSATTRANDWFKETP